MGSCFRENRGIVTPNARHLGRQRQAGPTVLMEEGNTPQDYSFGCQTTHLDLGTR